MKRVFGGGLIVGIDILTILPFLLMKIFLPGPRFDGTPKRNVLGRMLLHYSWCLLPGTLFLVSCGLPSSLLTLPWYSVGDEKIGRVM